MIRMRKSWWAAVALSAFLGCGQEEPAPAPPVAPPPATTSEVPRPAPPPTTEAAPAPTPEPKVEEPKVAPPIESPKVESPKEEPKKEEPKKEEPKKEEPKAAAVTLTGEEIAEIKKLPASEQALAMRQAVCPVSGENLGAMGMPIKVSAAGRTFYLCCKSCDKEVKADPQAVVAKLGK
jgi:outer membrane biosynthesis protein TonB